MIDDEGCGNHYTCKNCNYQTWAYHNDNHIKCPRCGSRLYVSYTGESPRPVRGRTVGEVYGFGRPAKKPGIQDRWWR